MSCSRPGGAAPQPPVVHLLLRFGLPIFWSSYVTRLVRTTATAPSALTVAGALAGCGRGDAEAAETLTLYSAQHESLVRTMLEGFPEDTGIALEFRHAHDAGLCNTTRQ